MLEIPEVPIDRLIERYDALLFDAYGVLVSVAGAMPGAPELIEMLNTTAKPYCVVTNDASKLPESAAMFEAALQRRYPDRGPLVFARLGKPARYLYEEALRRCGTRNAVMIGDQLETDIRGANAFGIDSALVATGVSAADLANVPAALRPTWRMRSIAPAGLALRARTVIPGPAGLIDK